MKSIKKSMQETLKIQPIEEKFNSGVKELVQSTLMEFKLNVPGTAYFDPELTDLTRHYQVEKAEYWILTNGEEVFGGIGIYPINSSTCEIQKLYIKSELRGQGWGGQLLRHALSYASKYYQFAYLDTKTELSDAIGMYKKFGFKELKVAPDHSTHNLMDHWFLKEL
ncbi:GNAT family N-acetyltransferase [Lactovum miscens]